MNNTELSLWCHSHFARPWCLLCTFRKPTTKKMFSCNIWPADTAGVHALVLILWMENNISLTSELGLGIYHQMTNGMRRKSDRQTWHVQFFVFQAGNRLFSSPLLNSFVQLFIVLFLENSTHVINQTLRYDGARQHKIPEVCCSLKLYVTYGHIVLDCHQDGMIFLLSSVSKKWFSHWLWLGVRGHRQMSYTVTKWNLAAVFTQHFRILVRRFDDLDCFLSLHPPDRCKCRPIKSVDD